MSNTNRNVVVFSSLGSFLFGYTLASVPCVIGLASFLDYFGIATTGLTAAYGNTMQGALNGVLFASAALGCWVIAWLADWVGRKRAFQIICVFSLVSTAMSAASVNIGMLLASRVIAGFGAGMLHTLCPVYQSEVAPPQHRGIMVGMHGFMFVSGLGGVTWFTVPCWYITNPAIQWRLVFASQAIPALLLAISSKWIIESPRWLMLKGKETEALHVLQQLHGQIEEHGHSLATAECYAIKAQIERDSANPSSLKYMFSDLALRKRLIMGVAIMFANQSTGQIVLYSYQVNLLSSFGIKGILPLVILAVYQSYAGVLNFVGGWMLDKFGRRALFLGGLIGSVVFVILHTGMIAGYLGTDNKIGQGFGIAFLFLFVTFFAAGVDVTTYVYASEIWPTAYRAQGMAFSIFVYFVQATIWSGVAPTAYATLGWKFYLCFIVLTFVSIGYVWRYFPETTGMSLEQIGAFFGDEILPQQLEPIAESDEKVDLNKNVVSVSVVNVV